jgi:hypothetical protein
MAPQSDYWFPAKRYGWGWGLPSRWEGWVALIAFFILLGLDVRFFQPHRYPFTFGLIVVLLSFALVALCWWKGEPPRWHWGKD